MNTGKSIFFIDVKGQYIFGVIFNSYIICMLIYIIKLI